jgi:hypothetical protein
MCGFTERILHEGQRIVRDLGDQLNALRLRCVIDASLENAAAVSVGSHFDTVGSDGVEDELKKTLIMSHQSKQETYWTRD